MPKNLASVKPVKVWAIPVKGKIYPGEVSKCKMAAEDVPCTLLTTARYKKLMDVVKAAVADQKAGDAIDKNPKSTAAWNDYNTKIHALRAAIEAAEKAGAL